MITSNFNGGLGNQMFQIMVAYAYAMKHGYDYAFNFYNCNTPNQGNTAIKYRDTLYSNLNRLPFDTQFKYIYKEPNFHYTPITIAEDGVIFDGYFQSLNYFDNVIGDIHKLFIFPDEIKYRVNNFLNEINGEKTAIHIRRGDYIKFSDYHLVCDINYYKTAMSMIHNTKLIIVSDDIEWCKSKFGYDNIVYSPFNDELEDLLLISLCENKIISNSSFSWWGVCLGGNKGTIISPSKWFNNSGPTSESIILDNWIKI